MHASTHIIFNTNMMVCRAQATISDLKRHLKGKVDLPEDQQRLVLSGKQLGDSKTLQESNVQIGSVLHLVLPVQGGLSATSFKFADVSNSKAMQRVELSYNEPRYTPPFSEFRQFCLVLGSASLQTFQKAQ